MSKLYAISDLHLAFSTPDKRMDYMLKSWENYDKRIEENWRDVIKQNDIVTICGDISWASSIERAIEDLKWIDRLPGKKILLKGNHDRWWKSIQNVRNALPPSIKVLHNDTLNIGDFSFIGSRLWTTTEYNLDHLIDWQGDGGPGTEYADDSKYDKELKRLEMSVEHSLEQRSKQSFKNMIIGLSHFPPCAPENTNSRAMALFEKAEAEHVICGHIHSAKKQPNNDFFPNKHNNIKIHLTSCDWLDFKPKLIVET